MSLCADDIEVDDGLTELLPLLHDASDGTTLPDGRRVVVTEFPTVIGDTVSAIGVHVGATMKAPSHAPRWPLAAGLVCASRPGDATVRILRLAAGPRGVPPFEAVEVHWGHAARWRLAPNRTPGLVLTVGSDATLLVSLDAPDAVLPDFPAARAQLSTASVGPGGAREQRRRAILAELGVELGERTERIPEDWEGSDADPWVVGALLELAVGSDSDDPPASGVPASLIRLVADGASVLVVDAQTPYRRRDRPRFLTAWEGISPDGAVTSIMFIESGSTENLPGPQIAWPSAESLTEPERSEHTTLSGMPIDRLGGVEHHADRWLGGSAREDGEDQTEEDGEEFEDLMDVELRTLRIGRVRFPSRRIHVMDPGIPGPASGLLDLELAHPGPYPVLEIRTDEADGRGTLILLGDATPARWVRAPLEDGAACWPPIDTGHVAILDEGLLEPVGQAAREHHHLLDGGSGTVDLLRSDPNQPPDGVLMGAIGGDVGVSVTIGLDGAGRPVALLVDNEDLAGVGGSS